MSPFAESVGFFAGLAALTFFFVGWRRKVKNVHKPFFGMLLLLVLGNSCLDWLEQLELLDPVRTDVVEDFFDLFIAVGWAFFVFACCEQVSQSQFLESAEKLQRTVDSLPELIWMSDANGLCTHFNKSWLNFTGRTIQQELGLGWADGVHPNDRDRCMKIYENAFDAREPFTMEQRLHRHDGEYRWLLVVGTPCFETDSKFAGYISSCIDITERKRAEELLRQHDQAFRTAGTPITFGDLDGRITDANEAFAKLFGFESTEQVIGRLNTEFHSEPISVAQINAGVNERGRFNGEITSKRIDGTPIDIHVIATLFADADGRPIGHMATFTDVTPRRQVERALREEEKRYRTLVEEAPEAIVVLDVDEMRFVDVNENATELFRIARKQLLEVGPAALSPKFQPDGNDSAETAMGFVQRALDGDTPAFEWLHLDAEGNEIPCEVRLARLPSNRRLVRGSVTDISERIKLEKALSRRALEAELLYQAVAMADEVDSLDEALQSCVDIVCEMTAWPVGHVYVPSSNGNQQLEPTKVWYLADEQRFTTFREVTERTPFDMGEGLPGRIWKSGEPAWIANVQDDDNFPRNKLCGDLGVKAAFGFPVTVRGDTVAILEFFNEAEVERNETLLLLVRSVGKQVGRVIERKEAEQMSRKRHELVAEELEKAKEALILKTRLAAIGQMSAQIAHELRNPLGAVSNAVFYLKRQVPVSEEKWSEYLSLIDSEVTTCNRFIGDLLDVTRGKALNRETSNLKDLIDRVLNRHDIPKSVDIEINCEPAPFEIFADNDQIVQVFDNLLKNSLDAIEQRSGKIEICAHRDGENDIITFSDSGRGISPEDQASVFDVLFTNKPAGTGLGLAICKQIIERHGGTIELVDRVSSGTTFQLRLPHILVFS